MRCQVVILIVAIAGSRFFLIATCLQVKSNSDIYQKENANEIRRLKHLNLQGKKGSGKQYTGWTFSPAPIGVTVRKRKEGETLTCAAKVN